MGTPFRAGCLTGLRRLKDSWLLSYISSRLGDDPMTPDNGAPAAGSVNYAARSALPVRTASG